MKAFAPSAPAGLLLAVLMTAVACEAGSAQRAESAEASLSGTIRGRFEGGVRVLPFALVEASTDRGRRTAVADSVGRYHIPALAGGEVRLTATHAGHARVTLTVRVPSGSAVTLDLELLATPVVLDGVNVDTRGVAEPEEPEARAAPEYDPAIQVRLLELSPALGEAGLAEAVQALPGNDPANPTDVLFMRGSTTELKLVLLDGVPVFTPFHVSGLIRSFEPATLGSAELHVGGAPARYDGGLTHVLDLRTRSARRDRARASGSIDFLSASVATETPLGERAGIVASARSLHDLGEVPLAGERPYGYQDVLVALEVDPAPAHRLRATGFWNSESVRLDFTRAPSRAEWSNGAGSLGWVGSVGGGTFEVTAGASRYEAELPLQPSVTEENPDPEAIRAMARSERLRIVAESRWGPAEAPVRVGVSFEDIRAVFSAENPSRTERSESRGESRVVGTFLDATRTLRPAVTVRAGLRADLFAGETLRLSPRAALHWEVGPTALLTVAAGRYHQVTRTPNTEVDESLEAFANAELAQNRILPIATADHVVLSLDQQLGRSVDLGLGGYWKRYEGLGSGYESIRNSGIDVRVRSSGAETTVWMGYGLSWFWSPRDLSGRASEFAGRHLLSAGASTRLGGPLRAEARLAYGAGLPSTSIPFGSSSADAPLEAAGPETLSALAAPVEDFVLDESFLRIDVEVHAIFEPQVGGRTWRVRPYLRLLNALDRRDALFYTYQPWRSDAVTPLAVRPILPILGVSFSF